jgi:hypothetical protein
MKKSWIQQLQERKNEMEEKKIESLRSRSRLLDKILEDKFSQGEDIHAPNVPEGYPKRSSSAPLTEIQELLDRRAANERAYRSLVPIAHPSREPVQVDDFGISRTESTYWYPADRQRLRHRMLEEARLEDGRKRLLVDGWETQCPPGPPEKRTSAKPSIEKHMLEEKVNELNRQRQERIEKSQQKYREILERSRPVERRGVIPITSNPIPTEVTDDLSERRQERRTYVVGSSQYERPVLFRPEVIYRPELPAVGLPRPEVLEKLKIPDHLKPKDVAAAPPWGRQTELDDKWQRVKVYRSRSQKTAFEPISKLEVDRELKIVRNWGLLKRNRRPLAKSLEPKKLDLIKSLPKDFVKQGLRSMNPAASLTTATLK